MSLHRSWHHITCTHQLYRAQLCCQCSVLSQRWSKSSVISEKCEGIIYWRAASTLPAVLPLDGMPWSFASLLPDERQGRCGWACCAQDATAPQEHVPKGTVVGHDPSPSIFARSQVPLLRSCCMGRIPQTHGSHSCPEARLQLSLARLEPYWWHVSKGFQVPCGLEISVSACSQCQVIWKMLRQ